MLISRIRTLAAISRRFPIDPDAPGIAIDISNTSEVLFKAPTDAEGMLHDFLDSLSFDELEEIQALVMLGKSFYENEPWLEIRKDVSLTKAEIISYLEGFRQYLAEYLKQGFIRLIDQTE